MKSQEISNFPPDIPSLFSDAGHLARSASPRPRPLHFGAAATAAVNGWCTRSPPVDIDTTDQWPKKTGNIPAKYGLRALNSTKVPL